MTAAATGRRRSAPQHQFTGATLDAEEREQTLAEDARPRPRSGCTRGVWRLRSLVAGSQRLVAIHVQNQYNPDCGSTWVLLTAQRAQSAP